MSNKKLIVTCTEDAQDCLKFEICIRKRESKIKSIEIKAQKDERVMKGQVIGQILLDQEEGKKDILSKVEGWIETIQPKFDLNSNSIPICTITQCGHDEFEEIGFTHIRVCMKCKEEFWAYPDKTLGVITTSTLSQFICDNAEINLRSQIDIQFSSEIKTNKIIPRRTALLFGEIITKRNENDDSDSDDDDNNSKIQFSLDDCIRIKEKNNNYRLDQSWILKYEKMLCSHQVIDDLRMCISCNAVVQQHENVSYFGLNGDHKKYLVGQEYAERLKNQAHQQLNTTKKLILVLDLDNTIIHAIGCKQSATYDDIPKEEVCEIKELQHCKYVVRFRPYLKELLSYVIDHFEIYVFTMAIFDYAKSICNHIRTYYADILANNQFAFKEDRIISRERFIFGNKDLSKILPDSEKIMLILDDLPSVWPKNYNNVLITLPYKYWKEKPSQENTAVKTPILNKENKKVENIQKQQSENLKDKEKVTEIHPEKKEQDENQVAQIIQAPIQCENQESLPPAQKEEEVNDESSKNQQKSFDNSEIKEENTSNQTGKSNEKEETIEIEVEKPQKSQQQNEPQQNQSNQDNKLEVLKPWDNYLLFAGPILVKLKEDYYSQPENVRDIRSSFRTYQEQVFKGVKVAMSSIVLQKYQFDIRKSFNLMGGQIVEELDKDIDYLVIGQSTKTRKVHNALKKGIKIIWKSWIEYSWYYNYKLDPDLFQVNQDLIFQKDNLIIEKELCELFNQPIHLL